MSTITKQKTMHSPAHPGEILRELYLKPMHVTIVNGRVPVTPDMAMRLAAVFATEAQLWVNLQAQHDLWIVSQKKPPSVKPLRQVA